MKIERIQLEPDETILMQVRKHWFVLAVQLFGLIGAALMPLVIYAIFSFNPLADTYRFTIHGGIVVTLYSAWLLIVWMGIFNVWNNYYLDVWTITNKRLIAIDQEGFFSRTTASFRFDRLQDIEVHVSGFIATLLDFGTLTIQTAGEEGNFKAYGLPHPGDLKAEILTAADTIAGGRIA